MPAPEVNSLKPTGLVQPLIDQFRKRTPLRTGSLIVTVFGDAIAPRGGTVWLGSLINVVAPLGISHRLVRTAVFRLIKEQVLSNEQIGRKSYYALTDAGKRQFAEATSRIYATGQPDWDGKWRTIILKNLSGEQRLAVRKDLQWLGFGSLGSDLLAHPRPNLALLQAHLSNLGAEEDIIHMDAELSSGVPSRGLLKLVSETWNLGELEAGYNDFVRQFRPILAGVKQSKKLTPADAFYLRTFLIHEYRKVLLRDPALPEELLPATWKGHTAQQLAGELYRLTVQASEGFVDQHFENQIGALPAPNDAFHKRFSKP